MTPHEELFDAIMQVIDASDCSPEDELKVLADHYAGTAYRYVTDDLPSTKAECDWEDAVIPSIAAAIHEAARQRVLEIQRDRQRFN